MRYAFCCTTHTRLDAIPVWRYHNSATDRAFFRGSNRGTISCPVFKEVESPEGKTMIDKEDGHEPVPNI
jgi:hypothetical protein